jgi:hypothetical protein
MAAGQFLARRDAEFSRNFNALVSLGSLVSFGIMGPLELRNSREPAAEHCTIERREVHISISQPTASRESASFPPLYSVF